MIIYEDLHLLPSFAKAHGILMGIAFVVVYPLGAWIIRLVRSSKSVWIHVAVQILGWGMMLAGFGIGIRMAKILDMVSCVLDCFESELQPHANHPAFQTNSHTVVGTIVVVLMILQPFIGLLQHLRYLRKQQKSLWNPVHKWFGRVLVILGMINGGLGLHLANNTTGGKIAYGVVAGICGVAFVFLIFWKGPNEGKDNTEEISDIEMEDSTRQNPILNVSQ